MSTYLVCTKYLSEPCARIAQNRDHSVSSCEYEIIGCYCSARRSRVSHMSHCLPRRDKRRQPNSIALSPFQKDVTIRQPQQLTFKAVSRARTTELSFYSEGLWCVVGKAASRHDRPSGSDAVSLHALRCYACPEMHRVVSSRIESSLFSVGSASLFTVLSYRLFRCKDHRGARP